ncbi:hypothetical protein SB861_03325 [Paraburkholderia sp. SIMBA_049]
MDWGLKRAAEVFKTVDWVVPAYFSVGAIGMLADAIEGAASVEQRQTILRDVLPRFYNDDYLAATLIDRYRSTIYVRDFQLPIAEAIEAAVLGLPHAAVSTLTPVLEGVLRKIAAERGGREEGGKKFFIIPELDELISKEERSPHRYEERITMLESLRDFFADRLYAHTKNYDGLDQLNRHGILHGLFDGYGDGVNFYRLISLLDLLCFALALAHGGSGFASEDTDESRKLEAYYRATREHSKRRPAI